MIVYETEYDKLFEKRNEIISCQILILTFYKEHQKITKDIINIFEIGKNEIEIKYYKLYNKVLNYYFCVDIINIILSFIITGTSE